ncbi:DgyrCDS7265 [Dimorphilus gyrociliatus]|uniref:DgyrCDS7265 n=1 Tax=Dimorphilus gyrociliatus TaxID=2664684 RepID=A0A7I8VT62_9ANNE|nr:DgyrCDS7265 [Dimorphilus gyrociliatus]
MNIITQQDYLVCGTCQSSFQLSDILLFMNHKRFDCDQKQDTEKILQCTTCSQMFYTPWSLLKHAQNVHGFGIYRDQINNVGKKGLSETTKRDHKALTEMIKNAINSTLQTLAKPTVDPTPVEENNPLMLLAEQATDESSNRCQSKTCAEICACPPGFCGAKGNDSDESERGREDEPLVMCTPEGQKCGSEEVDNCASNNCCCNSTDNCDCGIGLVLEKCCNSIVPKKRRRHLQKHLEHKRQVDHQLTNIPTSGGDSVDSSNNGDSNVTTDVNRSQIRKRRYPTTKPFSCEMCKESFNQRIHLKKHMSKHTGIKPYKCGQCNYSTVERSHLKVHIRVHTGKYFAISYFISL